MLVKLKKNHENFKDRFAKIRTDARDELKIQEGNPRREIEGNIKIIKRAA